MCARVRENEAVFVVVTTVVVVVVVVAVVIVVVVVVIVVTVVAVTPLSSGSERILLVMVWMALVRRMDRWIDVAQLEVRNRWRGAEHELWLLCIRTYRTGISGLLDRRSASDGERHGPQNPRGGAWEIEI